MSKSRKTSAAIVGLLDAIKSEGIEPVEDTSITASRLSLNLEKKYDLNNLDITIEDESQIPYHITLLETKLCQPWYLANRIQDYLTSVSCSDLIESIQKIGQQIPVLVRKVRQEQRYELICGARRLFACQYLGIKIKAAIVELSDKEALLAMDAENRPREDISPYERACDYKRWIETGIYKNYTEIMQGIGVKKSWFSQLMALADLHEDIIKAFGHPANLKQKWGYELQLICKKSSALESAMISAAQDLIKLNVSPASVFSKLKNVQIEKKDDPKKAPVWITDSRGKRIFRIRYSKSGRAQVAFNRRLTENQLNELISSAKNILEIE